MSDTDIESLIEQFSQLNLSKINPTIRPPKKGEPDLKKLLEK